mgnify:FL=1
MNIKNLSEAVLNDNSTNGIIYYFNGESYPYIQLNASGTTDAQYADTVLTGSEDSPIRELIGMSNVGISYWIQENLNKETNLNSLMEYCSLAMENIMHSHEINGKEEKMFLPSKTDFENSPVAAKAAYRFFADRIWTRTLKDDQSIWYMGADFCNHSMNINTSDAVSIPAFNLDLSKVLMVRKAVSGKPDNINNSHSNFIQYNSIKEPGSSNVKFLAQVDDTRVDVKKNSDTSVTCQCIIKHYPNDCLSAMHYPDTYLSAIIVDKNDNILYYNLYSKFEYYVISEGEKREYKLTIKQLCIPRNLPSGCKIGFFAEVRNEAYYMDTCGEITWMPIKNGQIEDTTDEELSDNYKPVSDDDNEVNDLLFDNVLAEIRRFKASIVYFLDTQSSQVKKAYIKNLAYTPSGIGILYLSSEDASKSFRMSLDAYKKEFFFSEKEAESALCCRKQAKLVKAVRETVDNLDISYTDAIEAIKIAFDM